MLKMPPIVRLAIGLTLLSVSLLMAADLLGLIPDSHKQTLQTRKALSELLAVEVAGSLERDDTSAIKSKLESIGERYTDISSLGLRLNDQSLLYVFGDHSLHWSDDPIRRGTSTHVTVPIRRNDVPWGVLEITFGLQGSTISRIVSENAMLTLVALVCVCGFFINWLFLRRALKELDPSSVVPERVSAAFDVLAEGLVMLDRSGRIVLFNAAFEEKTSLQSDRLIGLPLSDLDWTLQLDDEHSHDQTLPWVGLLETGVSRPARRMNLKLSGGEVLRFTVGSTTITSPDGVIKGAVVTFNDITELENKNLDLLRLVEELQFSEKEISRKNRELEILATRDPLTGALNRRSLFEAMDKIQEENRESGRVLSAIMVDIDHFKSINDQYGHAVGDDVIVMLSRILTDVSDSACLVGRYGGEEFVIALPGFSEAQAGKVAEVMRVTIADGTYATATMPRKISASFGVATDSKGLLTPGALVDLADKGLYQAKETGRNRVVRYSTLGLGSTATGQSEEETSHSPVIDSEEQVEALPQPQPEQEMPDTQSIGESATLSEPGQAVQAEGASLEHRADVLLTDRLMQAIRRSVRQKTLVVVLCIEVDALEVVNNTSGSKMADSLVRDVSQRLNTLLRDTDTVVVDEPGTHGDISIARTGVADIVVVLSDVRNAESVTWVVRRVREEMSRPVQIGFSTVSLHAKIGASLFPADGDNPPALLANARQALREARKTDDRSACVFFDRRTNELAAEALRLESELSLALDRDEFSLVYQPIIDIDSGLVEGFEVLLRWKNAHHGLVSPSQFIPIAEQAGIIESIGRWVFDKAAHQLKQWDSSGRSNLYLSVNVSAVQFRTSGFIEYVLSTLDEAGIAPDRFVMELTETSLIENIDSTAEIISQLQSAGFKIALDDFGTGYSSLVYLKNFAVDAVKIDRSFFAEFPGNTRDTSLIKAIISLGRSLGLKIVAEGVETLSQLDVLMSMHCDSVQGFVFSEALTREQATGLLKDPRAIRQKVHSLRGYTSGGREQKNTVISGVLNKIDPLDIAALSNAASRKRKLRVVQSR